MRLSVLQLCSPKIIHMGFDSHRPTTWDSTLTARLRGIRLSQSDYVGFDSHSPTTWDSTFAARLQALSLTFPLFYINIVTESIFLQQRSFIHGHNDHMTQQFLITWQLYSNKTVLFYWKLKTSVDETPVMIKRPWKGTSCRNGFVPQTRCLPQNSRHKFMTVPLMMDPLFTKEKRDPDNLPKGSSSL